MNNKGASVLDEYTLFRLLCELEAGADCSQRDLAARLDAALGLVNNYLKAAAAKGWVRVKELPGKRCSYHLTGKGRRELQRLALKHSRYLLRMLPELVELYRPLCDRLKAEGVERVALCGIDGAEPAWLAAVAAGLEISQVMDTEKNGARFMGREVVSLAHALLSGVHRVLIGSHSRAAELKTALLELGMSPDVILVPDRFVVPCQQHQSAR